jgi:uncharacterized membrane protein YfcA
MELVSAIGIILFALLAGLLGALLGLGGGIIIIPALTLVFGYPMQEAIGASLVAVIASSVGSASHYIEQGLSNIRLGLILGIATSLGSLLGALVAVYTDQYILAAAFGALLLYTAIYMVRKRDAEDICPVDQGGSLDLSCSYTDRADDRQVEYGVRNLEKGMVASLGGGSLAGLLGVGGGIINVPIMKAWMGVPFRAACATSNFMIGLTALAGAIVYYEFGLINAVLAAIVAIGTFTGAMVGSRLSSQVQGSMLKLVFAVVLVAVAALMFLKAAGVMP